MKTIGNEPICKCRECQQPMDVVWQQPLLPGREGMFLVTCDNRVCGMYSYTFSDRNYPTVDLSKYHKAAC
jgi:hypothetical protein